MKGHQLAVGQTQERESSPVKDQRSVGVPRNQVLLTAHQTDTLRYAMRTDPDVVGVHVDEVDVGDVDAAVGAQLDRFADVADRRLRRRVRATATRPVTRRTPYVPDL